MSDNPAQEVLDNSAATKEVVDTGANWYDALEPDLKAHPSITKFKSQGDLAKSYVELQKTLGSNKIVIPTDKSTPEEWRAYFKAAGAPDKEEDYVAGMEDMPEQIRLKEDQIKSFRKSAYDAGVTKKQFDAMFGTYKKLTSDGFNQELDGLSKLKTGTETALRSEWGAAYEAKIDGAQKVVNTFFKDKGIRPEFSILANDKGFISAMAAIAEKLGEDVITGGVRNTMTPTESIAEINRMMADKKGPLYDDLSPEHNAAVERLHELNQMAYPNG